MKERKGKRFLRLRQLQVSEINLSTALCLMLDSLLISVFSK